MKLRIFIQIIAKTPKTEIELYNYGHFTWTMS